MPDTSFYEHQTNSEAQTIAFAAALAPMLQAGDLVAFVGDLGAGKSTVAREIVRTRIGNPDMDVPSPTFTLVQTYEPVDGPAIFHTDLYRIEDSEDVYDLGLEEEKDDVILLVEWPDRMPQSWFSGALIVSLTMSEKAGERHIKLVGDDRWKERLEALYADADRDADYGQ